MKTVFPGLRSSNLKENQPLRPLREPTNTQKAHKATPQSLLLTSTLAAFTLPFCKPADHMNSKPYTTTSPATEAPLTPVKRDNASSKVDNEAEDANETTEETPDCCTFPFKDRKVLAPYKGGGSGGREFGASRSGRLHAATDLLRNAGTPIRAIADGKVTDYYEFYEGTDAVVVDHDIFVARYGEVGRMAEGVSKGSPVKKGQVIAYVGDLIGIDASMLHLELYKGTLSGELSGHNNSFQRRPDIFNPTACVDLWIAGDTDEACWKSEKTLAEGLK